jgi:NAD(P)-dependent dehydrogenase (short-subunit alcohol dehydrogenase family)
MTIADRAVLVTGANRGIGRALVEEALSRGAKRVYAVTRQPLAHPDGRVTPLRLDVTNQAQIQAAAEQVESLDVLVNKAGIWLYDDLSDRVALEEHLAVNFFGSSSGAAGGGRGGRSAVRCGPGRPPRRRWAAQEAVAGGGGGGAGDRDRVHRWGGPQ